MKKYIVRLPNGDILWKTNDEEEAKKLLKIDPELRLEVRRNL